MSIQALLLLTVGVLLVVGMAIVASGDRGGDSTDRQEILAHIDGIFRAYLEGDRAALRRTHTADWTGFQGPSTKIERGIEAYMANAERSLEQLQGLGYEILDQEVQLHGDIGIVYYVAHYRYRDRSSGAEGSIPLRSIDIYRKGPGGWNQSGSHITPIPSRPSWLSGAPAGFGALRELTPQEKLDGQGGGSD